MKIFVTSAYQYWGDFLPTDLRDPACTRQVGGGETAMVSIARELAARGHQVTVFYDVRRPGTYEGVEYLPTALYPNLVCMRDHDVLVSWDAPMAFRYSDRARAHILAFQLNDSQVGVFGHAVDKYFHPSKWHADRFTQLYGELDKRRMRWTLTNGLDLRRYTDQLATTAKVDGQIIYSSSPDRGLHHLLRMWPTIREAVPTATLEIYYDLDKWLNLTFDLEQQGYQLHTADRAHYINDVRKAGLEGVTWHGGVGQWQLANAQLHAHMMVYPCDPVQPTEGFSMTCLEALAAGCHLITSTADALPELWSSMPDTTLLPLPVEDGVWVDAIVRVLGAPHAQARVPEDYTWAALAEVWEKELEQCLSN